MGSASGASSTQITSPADHYAEAERILRHSSGYPWGSPENAGAMAEAQVHATLAAVAWPTYQQSRDMHGSADSGESSS